MAMTGIFSLVFLKFYESGLISSLLFKRVVHPFRDLHDLARTGHSIIMERNSRVIDLLCYFEGRVEAGEMSFMVEAGASAETQLRDPNVSVYEGMRRAVKVMPLIRSVYHSAVFILILLKAHSPGFLTPRQDCGWFARLSLVWNMPQL